jgi:hypothetical protein
MMLMIAINIFKHRLYLWGSVLSVPLAGQADGGKVRFNRLSGGDWIKLKCIELHA